MSAINFKTLTDEQVTEFFHSIDYVLTDCDGVLWLYATPFPNAAEVMNTFDELGMKVFYVTNNSTKTKDEFAEKCKSLNFTVTAENMVCSSNLVASYLQDIGFDGKVYIVGSSGIGKELDKVGIPHCGIGPDPADPNVPVYSFAKDPDVKAVIVGFDEHFSYPKMTKAASYLADPDTLFIGTNTDTRFPMGNHAVIPGTGSLIRCIECCSERKATIVGKPEPYLADMLMDRFDIDPKRTLMIGDRSNTDILLGTRCGFKTLLVLSGVTSLSDINAWSQSNSQEEKDLVPDYYIDEIGNLLPYLKKYKEGCSN